MSIKKIIQSVTIKQVKKTQKVVKRHFEGGHAQSQMNMIAFD